MKVFQNEEVYRFGNESETALVTVGVSLYNYSNFILPTLRSIERQTLQSIELIVIDDASTDGGGEVVINWMKRYSRRFSRALLVRKLGNAGLSAARNRAIELARSKYFFVLDADNLIYPRCLERLYQSLDQNADAAFAYPIIEMFGEEQRLMGTELWSQDRLACGNYIDVMSLLRIENLRKLDGYAKMEVTGWEDYDLWCRFAEKGWHGIRVAEILARYRVHSTSMLNTTTRAKERLPKLLAEMKRRHPWLRISEECH